MIELLQQKLARYTIAGADEQEQALKEILQELTLYALWREGFFNVAAFQGGTCLRILYGLPRFSEDLDFILQTPDPDFSWARTVEGVAAVLAEFGVAAELTDRTRADRAVRQAMLKDNSLGGQLDLKFTDLPPGRKLRIKLEVDTNPPSGSAWSQRFHALDWAEAIRDVEPFLNGMERRSLAVWGEPLFTERAQQLFEQLKMTQ